MNRRFGIFVAALLMAFVSRATAQTQTLARLAHDTTSDIPHSTSVVRNSPETAPTPRVAVLRESALARAAARAFFVDFNRTRAYQLSTRALARDPQDAEALFVRMEIAAMSADDATMLQSASRLCELGVNARGDARIGVAAARLREAAANTAEFRSITPQLQALLANSLQPWPDVQQALLAAAMDGAPGLDPYSLSRSAGILTDWRIVGPLGLHPLLDQQPISPNDDLSQNSYQNRRVENFAFPDGRIVLPDYFPRRGIFYAAAEFSSLTSGSWTVQVESTGLLEVFADGQRVLRSNAPGNSSAVFDVIPGPHRVLVKFSGAAAPLRISVARTVEPFPTTPPRKVSLQEMTYSLAARDYAAGQFSAAAKQIEGVPFNATSVPLQFLLSQTHIRSDPTMWESHRSACKTLLNAIASYRSLGQPDDARATQKKLDGCAPESLDYAQALSTDGNHAEAVRSLQRLLAAAPLNRAAREMLVRELQLSGDDEGAQQAAAEWLRIAPNAEDYHRLAAEWSEGTPYHDIGPASDSKSFYLPYRRDATAIASQSANLTASGSTLMLVDDHVAIARPDGSVSVYIHRAMRALTDTAAAQLSAARIPHDAQVLALRIVHPDGSTAALNNTGVMQATLAPGDAIDEEYTLNYTGDGGIAEHAEAFQFVFGSFDEQVLDSRFVVLTPAVRADRGAVISTGEVPAMTTTIRNGMVERIWEKHPAPDTAALSSGAALAIVRVVEDEHGWTEPSSAEHRHKIETIHPGPRPSDS